jgi:GMP synthase (glutamine-hydrolysing)
MSLMVLPLAVFITGDPVPGAKAARGDFFRMITEGVGPEFVCGFEVVVCTNESHYEDPRAYCGIIVSGSPARLNDREDWMLRTEDALCDAHEKQVPILGICFGHQLLGEALGGRVEPNPNGREIGTVQLTHRAADSLLDALESEPTVAMSHLDSVVEVPPGATIIRSTSLDPHAALRFSETTWGVQFHPEMDAEIVGHSLEDRRSDIAREGLDVDRLLAARVDSPYGPELLSAFARFCASRGPSGKTP